MADGAETKRELFCGNTNGDEMKLGCTNSTDGNIETCFCKAGDTACNTGENTWPIPKNNSSPNQINIINLVTLLALGVFLPRKCE